MEALILLITGVGALVAQMTYFLQDDRTPDNTPVDNKFKKYWHLAGGALHIWMGYVMYRLYGLDWGLLTTSVMWHIFDGIVNTFALKKEWWYIGTTSFLDRAQQFFAKIVHLDARLFSAILKTAFLVISVIMVFLHK